jgi:ElaB/YqjD/DUF883 family membrane-anchored ribosome-binding protein
MTDIYTEDPDEFDTRPGALEQLRAEVARARHELEHRIQSSASDVVDETRMLVRRVQHKVNSRLGSAALIAFGTGIALGLLAAILSGTRSSSRR